MVALCCRCFSGMLVLVSPVSFCVLSKDSLLSFRLVCTGHYGVIKLVAEIVLFDFGG
jgi:hypothetical protein